MDNRGRIALESVIHSDGWRGYDGLVDLGYQKHFRVNHGDNEFATAHSHINGMRAFGPMPKLAWLVSEECVNIPSVSI